MEKPAITKYNIHPLLNKRWSPRAFMDKPVEEASLQRIFEAARWAPSSYNEQPWRFIVGLKGDTTWDLIFESLAEFNQNWAKMAPVLILNIGKTHSGKTNKPNKVFQYDVGQSVAHITFQVMKEGLFMHQMGGFDPSKATKLLNIPNEYQPLTVMAIGHIGKPETLPEDLKVSEIAERDRKPLDEIFFEERFGNPSSLV